MRPIIKKLLLIVINCESEEDAVEAMTHEANKLKGKNIHDMKDREWEFYKAYCKSSA